MTETAHNMNHLKFLDAVAARDVRELQRKEATYQGSWKRRGGVGAYMMAVRKSDRLEEILRNGYRYNVFAAIERDPSGKDGTALAEVRDLRRYLLLIEAEMTARGVVDNPMPHEELLSVPATDSNKHAERDTFREAFGDRAADLAERVERDKHTPAQQEAALSTDEPPVYRVQRGDVDGLVPAAKPASSTAPWRTVVKGDSVDDPHALRWLIVDRTLVDDSAQLEHLVKLRTGLNNVEYEQDCPPWFRHMYKFDEHGRNEWVLQPRYRRWSETGHR